MMDYDGAYGAPTFSVNELEQDNPGQKAIDANIQVINNQ
jgi:hypothetical protein